MPIISQQMSMEEIKQKYISARQKYLNVSSALELNNTSVTDLRKPLQDRYGD